MRDKGEVGAAELRQNLKLEFKVDIPYHQIFDGKKKALDIIQGKWNDRFHMLFSFKVEVEKTSPGSVVEIDHELVRGKMKTPRGKPVVDILIRGIHGREIFRQARVAHSGGEAHRPTGRASC